mgnify:FL=1
MFELQQVHYRMPVLNDERISIYNKIYDTFSETIRSQTARFIV